MNIPYLRLCHSRTVAATRAGRVVGCPQWMNAQEQSGTQEKRECAHVDSLREPLEFEANRSGRCGSLTLPASFNDFWHYAVRCE